MLKLLGVVLIVSFLTFMLTKLLPGDPVNLILGSEAEQPRSPRPPSRTDLGLDEAVPGAVLDYIYGVFVERDLGKSYHQDIADHDLPQRSGSRPRSS